VPTQSEAKRDVEKRPEAFFEIFGQIFEREARFSKKTPVPGLGKMDDGKEAVEAFYNFWYDFDSWRSFEYLDKEVNEGSDKYVSVYFTRFHPELVSDGEYHLFTAATISVTPRRKTRLSVHVARRKTTHEYGASWISLSPSTRV
jgi:hypothetical protein